MLHSKGNILIIFYVLSHQKCIDILEASFFDLVWERVSAFALVVHLFALKGLPNINLSWEEYAVIPVPYYTSYFALFEIANLRQAKFILVTAAACSVGIALESLSF